MISRHSAIVAVLALALGGSGCFNENYIGNTNDASFTLPDAGADASVDAGDAGASDAGDAGMCPTTEPDSGPPADAGPAFGGIGISCEPTITAIDAGTDDAGNPIDGGTMSTPGSCASELVCQNIAGTQWCSLPCTSDSDCGSTNTMIALDGGPDAGALDGGFIANVCVFGSCFAGCDTVAAPGCIQNSFACVNGPTGEDLCLPDCTQAAPSFCTVFAGYPTTFCNDITEVPGFGTCSPRGPDCSDAGSAACGESMVCAPTAAVCVDDCRPPVPDAGVADAGAPDSGEGGVVDAGSVDAGPPTTGVPCTSNTDCVTGACFNGQCLTCPFGYACDQGSDPAAGSCVIQSITNYGSCTLSLECPDSPPNECISAGSNPDAGPAGSVCLQSCVSDADCPVTPASQTCSLPMANGATVCAVRCTARTVCPGTTTCKPFPGAADAGGFCLGQ